MYTGGGGGRLAGAYENAPEKKKKKYFGPEPRTLYSLDQKSTLFSRIFTREGDIEYTGCGNTEHRRLKDYEILRFLIPF
jgi:hypothetical protein